MLVQKAIFWLQLISENLLMLFQKWKWLNTLSKEKRGNTTYPSYRRYLLILPENEPIRCVRPKILMSNNIELTIFFSEFRYCKLHFFHTQDLYSFIWFIYSLFPLNHYNSRRIHIRTWKFCAAFSSSYYCTHGKILLLSSSGFIFRICLTRICLNCFCKCMT